MNSMNQMINTIIEKNITDYITKISKKYNLDTEELTNIWDEMQNKESKKVRSKSKDDSSADESDSSENKKSKTKKVVSKNEKPEKMVCSYIFTKGNRLNETCGCKTKDDSLFCTKHKKYEDLETKKTKPIIPTNTKNLILRKNKKLGKMVHKDTNMVFNDEKIVIGKCIDDTLHKLLEEDIEICKKFSFKFEENYEEVEISDISEVSDDDDENEESKNVKKSVLKSVNLTRDKLEDVVDILNELQIGDEDEEEDEDEELEEE